MEYYNGNTGLLDLLTEIWAQIHDHCSPKKGKTGTDWELVMRNLGTSRVFLRNYESLGELEDHMKNGKLRYVTFICNTTGKIRLNIHRELSKLADCPKYLRRELERGTKDELMYLWIKAHCMIDIKKKRKVLRLLEKYLQNHIGPQRLPAPRIMFTFYPTTPRGSVKRVLSKITDSVLERNMARALKESIRLIPKRQKTISEYLSNAKKMAQQENFVCAGSPWCSKNTHFSKDLCDMKGILGKVGKYNANDVPLWVRENANKEIIEVWLKKLIDVYYL